MGVEFSTCVCMCVLCLFVPAYREIHLRLMVPVDQRGGRLISKVMAHKSMGWNTLHWRVHVDRGGGAN